VLEVLTSVREELSACLKTWLWVVTLYSVVVGYQRFEGTYCLLLPLLQPWRWR